MTDSTDETQDNLDEALIEWLNADDPTRMENARLIAKAIGVDWCDDCDSHIPRNDNRRKVETHTDGHTVKTVSYATAAERTRDTSNTSYHFRPSNDLRTVKVMCAKEGMEAGYITVRGVFVTLPPDIQELIDGAERHGTEAKISINFAQALSHTAIPDTAARDRAIRKLVDLFTDPDGKIVYKSHKHSPIATAVRRHFEETYEQTGDVSFEGCDVVQDAPYPPEPTPVGVSEQTTITDPDIVAAATDDSSPEDEIEADLKAELDAAGSLTLDGADAQDFADVICGLTVIGAYSSNAGLNNDSDRIASLRKRLVLENRDIAEALLDADVTTACVSPTDTMLGVRAILDGDAE